MQDVPIPSIFSSQTSIVDRFILLRFASYVHILLSFYAYEPRRQADLLPARKLRAGDITEDPATCEL